MRRVAFVLAISGDVPIRHGHTTDRGKVIRFVVQLEVLVQGKWRPVVRYDSAHGQSHRHRFRPREGQRKELLGMSFEDALTFAEGDLRQNWEQHLLEFGEER